MKVEEVSAKFSARACANFGERSKVESAPSREVHVRVPNPCVENVQVNALAGGRHVKLLVEREGVLIDSVEAPEAAADLLNARAGRHGSR